MPRGQKSKLRAREKRRQARSDTYSVDGADATLAEEAGSHSSGESPQSSPAARLPQGPQRVPPITTVAQVASGTRGAREAKDQDEGGACFSEASAITEKSWKDPLNKRVVMLLQLLLNKYKIRERVTKAEMMKIVNKRYKEHFPELLRRVSEHMEMVFGLDLKEADSRGEIYVLVSKLEITNEEIMVGGRGFPKNGILMPLLGMIYTSGKRATEEAVWKYLNVLGIYDGERHYIFGEPRKLITKDLVREKYLEYQQVPNSDPPRFEFLWGPRARNEATKKKVLEFLAKISHTDPYVFQALCEEAWRNDKESAKGGESGGAGPSARVRFCFRVKPSRPSHSSEV